MVSTRRGGRANSEVETAPKECSDIPATPSTGRTTRSSAKQTESPSHLPLVESSSQLDEDVGRSSTPPPTSLVKRCARASRLHSPEHPCTPVSSIHDADVSDSESCCSVLSDAQLFPTKTRRRRVPSSVAQKDKVNPEVESSSSVASKTEQIPRRSTRKKPASGKVGPAGTKTGETKDDEVDDSCSSAVSEYRRVTRSQRKSVRNISKEQTEDSDAESCISSVSGAEVPPSTSRRKRELPPFIIDEASEQSRSPAPRSQPIRATRRKAMNTPDLSDPMSADSEGFESGPSNSIITHRGRKSRVVIVIDSDSDLTDKGTPCSSRTNPGNSFQHVRVTRRVVKNLCLDQEKASEPLVEESSFNDSRLEHTVITEDADITLVEEDRSQISEEKNTEMEVDLTVMEAEDEKEEKKEDDSEPALMTTGQQEEPFPDCKDDSTSELEKMQQIIEASEPLGPCQPDAETHEEASEKTGQEGHTMEVVEVDDDSSQEDQAVSADVGVEKMEKVEDVSDTLVENSKEQVESSQVTSQQQQHDVTVVSGSDQPPHDSSVQSKNVISLLDSSDDDDDDDDFADKLIVDSKDEEQEDVASRRGEFSGEAAAASVDGLFMIDTRPGQEADEDYYKERPSEARQETKQTEAEQEVLEDEFVDEEADDEDDDEDAILFSSRNKKLDTLSSRIDPGIRLKELGGLYINFGDSKSKSVSSSLQKVKGKKIQDEVMDKSVIGPDFQKKEAVPPYKESQYALKRKGKAEREKTTGEAWFNMKAPEVTQELKGDLRVLKMRGSLDPKRFYKKNDRDGFPKYFQVGTVVDSPADFYHSHIPKKQRKRTMVEELLADAEFRQTNKKKYQQIMTEKAAQLAGRRNNKKKKFHKK